MITISLDLIKRFRAKVNSNSSFVYQKYHDVNGKDNWRLICSCMDWITVAASHLVNSPALDSNVQNRVMQVYSMISSIDLISESVTQLHRVLIDDRTTPFSGQDTIFRQRVFRVDDNEYFKEVRSCFGAHPVNLKVKNPKARRFASWPFEPHWNPENILEVRLYSSIAGEPDLGLGINLDELTEFLLSRYSYLEILSDEISTQYELICSEMRRREIVATGTPNEILQILKNETVVRMNNEYYNSTIDELSMVFSVTCPESSLKTEEDKFKSSLFPLIEEIQNNLQEMNFANLANESIFNPDTESDDLSYELEKIYIWVLSGGRDPMLEYHFRRLNEVSDGRYSFDIRDGKKLTLLKVKMLFTRAENFS